MRPALPIYHRVNYRRQVAFEVEEPLEESGCCLEAPPFVGGICLQVVAIRGVEADESLVMRIFGKAKYFAELNGVGLAQPGELAAPFQNEDDIGDFLLRRVVLVGRDFDRLELDLSVEPLEMSSDF